MLAVAGMRVFVDSLLEHRNTEVPDGVELPLGQVLSEEPYEGTEEDRDWIFPVKGYFTSFFKYWNKCKKHIK